MTKTAADQRWEIGVSASVFLFFALMLTVPSGYSYGAAGLFVLSLAWLVQHRDLRIDAADKTLCYLLLAVFVVSVAMLLVHGNKARSLDQSSRCLLAIPILIFLRAVPPRLEALWAGLVTGSVAAACVAAWQIHWAAVPVDRATGFVTSAVPFGNMALMMGLLCIAGIPWARRQQRPHKPYWITALLLGAVAGVYASVASGSRGGWLALGPVVLVFAAALVTRRNAARSALGAAVLAAILAAMWMMPDSTVRQRYDEAITEVSSYVQENDPRSSIGGRLEMWRAAAISIPERPLLGYSRAEYPEHLQTLIAQDRVAPYAAELVNTHNNYLEVWLFEGLPGLLALLALYGFPLWFFCLRLRSEDRSVKSLAVAGAVLQVSFFTFGLTHVILGRNSGVVFFVVTLVILWTAMRQAELMLAVTHAAPEDGQADRKKHNAIVSAEYDLGHAKAEERRQQTGS